MCSVDELLARDAEDLKVLWHLLKANVSMTRETEQTLESMLDRGETAQEMAKRLSLPLDLAHTRRTRNGRKVLEVLMERYTFLFQEVFPDGSTES